MTIQDITPEGSVVPVYLDPTPPEPIDDDIQHLFTPDPRQLRQDAYRDEADPLFFKWQRGEDGATEQDWLDKIEEIRERYPYPEGEAS